MVHTLESILQSYGLFAVFVICLFEGDVILVMAGVCSHLGFFTPLEAFVAAWIGLLTGDCGFYYLGRKVSARVQASPTYQRMYPKIQFLSRRWGMWEIPASRFVYGTRTVSMIFWGIHRLNFFRFLTFDSIGITLWTALLIPLGYFLSHSAKQLIGEVKRIEIWLLGALILTVLSFLLLKFFVRGRLKKANYDASNTP
jgi:membrane protein DedA with SNARE-associated domain